jgi:uncharacterized protein YigE (DUF2233 family)
VKHRLLALVSGGMMFIHLDRQASAVDYTNVLFAGKRATVCRVQLPQDSLQLFLRDDAGRPLRSFAGVERWLQPRSRRLVFAMNAGMYHENGSPVGLCVIGGREITPLNTGKGDGNFFLQPNGVFLISTNGARVIATTEYAALREKVLLATQSGPLLVHRGRIHPAFRRESTSRYLRNAVGVPSPQVALFVITEDPVSFHELAVLLRDELHCPDALFLDGAISSLHAPALHRSDGRADLGPIIGVVAP